MGPHTLPLCVTLLCTSVAASLSTARVEREAWVMGTRVRIDVESASLDAAAQSAEQALRAIEGIDGLLSTWREESGLSALNRAEVGRSTTAPNALLSLLDEVFVWSERTQGAFDPAIGPLIDAWGVRSQPRTPSEDELVDAMEASGSGAFSIHPSSGTALRARPHAWIDAGAFGKGAALRAVQIALAEDGIQRALVDLGGQVLALSDDEDGWSFEVAHPLRRNEPVIPLRLVNVSAATSGASERPGHLLDPRNGRPATDWGSVTVVDPDPLLADILSTALYVMGPEDGLAWALGEDAIAALFLTVDGDRVSARWTPSMARWLGPSPQSPHTQSARDVY